jgi:hypothetical protein
MMGEDLDRPLNPARARPNQLGKRYLFTGGWRVGNLRMRRRRDEILFEGNYRNACGGGFSGPCLPKRGAIIEINARAGQVN